MSSGFPIVPLGPEDSEKEIRRLRRELDELKRRHPRVGKFVWKVFPDHNEDRFGTQSIVVTGDGQLIKAVADELDGKHLDRVAAFISTAGASAVTVQIRNVTTGHDMLSTPITIDAGIYYSGFSAVQPDVDESFNQVSEGDLIAIDVDADGGGTAEGLGVISYFL